MTEPLAPLNAALAGRYSVERELGRGGMATVWLARDLRHDRLVAIKILHPELAGAIGVDRFLREIRLTARLTHPGIIPVLDSGVFTAPDGVTLPWYSMTYVAGESLRGRLDRERQLPIDEALRITGEAAAALEAAHREGIIHRDIKPENLLLSGGHTYVADFGVARALLDTGGERLTGTGIALGTPSYMSPEQVTGEPVDARTDLYSLASVLYEMLAGEPPFTGATTQAVVGRRIAEPARAIRPVRSTVPVAVEAAVLKALERLPADRFPDVSTFVTALRSAPVAPARAARFAGVGAAAVVAALAVWYFGPRPGAEHTARDPEVVALYQRGVEGYDKRTPAGIEDGVRSLLAAVARDSTYARAWAALARSYVRAYERRFILPGVGPDAVLHLAVRAADRALANDRASSDGWYTRAIVSRVIDPTNMAPSIRASRQALALDSTNGRAWHILALGLAETGELDSALDGWRHCVTVSPGYTQGIAFLALAHYWRGAFDSAAHWADSTLAVDPNFVLGRTAAGYVAIERGDFTRAKNAFEAARRLSTDVEVVNALAGAALAEARGGAKEARTTLQRAESLAVAYEPMPQHTAVYLAQVYAALGDANGAFAWLRRYTPLEDLHFQLHLRYDPPFQPLHNDPRFRAMLLREGPR